MIQKKLSDNNTDIIISYSGGSGGFLLLHFLLLTGQYHCSFDEENDFISQWKISDPSEWKTNEIWPNNDKTVASATTKSKIYFICNPTDEIIKKYTGKKIVVYTSLVNQINLAKYKRANWFRPLNILPIESIEDILLSKKSAVVNNTTVYSNIIPFIESSDIAIKLEDFVNDRGQNLLSQLDLPAINIQQKQLITHWKKLHPESLLNTLNILP
jgi:hypothetical protein